MELMCPKGKYMAELKYFGFLYQKDKRINSNSDPFSFCYKAENPLVPDYEILAM